MNEFSSDFSGFDGTRNADLCGARYGYDRCRHFCFGVPKTSERSHDCFDWAVLGCQRNLAGLGVGILLVAFPMAHGMILGGLYLPVTFMLIGLILRGVAFDFRVSRALQTAIWLSMRVR